MTLNGWPAFCVPIGLLNEKVDGGPLITLNQLDRPALEPVKLAVSWTV